MEMEVTVEDLGKLKRKLSVEVPLSDVAAAYDEVYTRIRSNIRVDGFRPGRFPRSMVEKRFKAMMAQEAMENLVPKYLDQVLHEKELQPATQPHFHNLDIDKARPFRFDVEFEIVPDFDLLEPDAYTLEEKPVELEPDAVDDRLEEMRQARAELEDKGDAVAEEGDWVTFGFEGTIDGEPFPGNSAADQKAEIGSGRYLQEFEEQLLGVKAGDEKSFPLTFPDDYGEADLAGKTAQFELKVSRVEAKKPPELDDAFAAQFGEKIDSLEALRKQVEEQLSSEKRNEIDSGYSEALAEQIRERSSFDVPESLVENALAAFERQKLQEDPALKDDAEKLEQLKSEEADAQKASLRLSYILGKYAKEQNVTVSGEEIRNRFLMQAYMVRENPEDLMRTQLGESMLRQIQEQMLHQKALGRMVDRILGREPETPPEAPPPERSAADAATEFIAKTINDSTGEPTGESAEPETADAAQEDSTAAPPTEADAAPAPPENAAAPAGSAPTGEADAAPNPSGQPD